MRDLARAIRPPTGIFALTQSLAALAIQAIRSLGLRVPEDVAVVGMGSSKSEQCCLTPISTVNRNAYTTGQQAVELLIKRIKGDCGPAQKILTPPSLEIRESSTRSASQLFLAETLGKKTNCPPITNRRRKTKNRL